MIKTKRVIAVFAIFCMMFTSLPMFNEGLISHAATKPKLSVKLVNNKPALSWTKASKQYNGYAVFKNNQVYKRLSTKARTHTDQSVGNGQTNTYQIKTYKKTKKTKKIKQWYNKETKKWQNSKPAKKYRGRSRRVKKTTYSYSYKVASNVVKITTNTPIIFGRTDKKSDFISIYANNGKSFAKCALTQGHSATLSLETTSGRTPSGTSDNPNVLSVDGNMIRGIRPGTATLTYSLGENATYKAASTSVTVEVKPVPCASHSYKAATCTSPKKCTVCGATEGDALGHSWNSGTITKQPTTSTTGIKTYTCTRCNETETEIIPKLSNNPVVVDPETLKSNPWKDMEDDGYAIGSTVTMTDYKNKTRTFTKNYKNQWVSNYTTISLTDDSLLCYNKEVDGIYFEGPTKMQNYHGTTFKMDNFGEYDVMSGNTGEFNDLGNPIKRGHGYSIIAYNINKNLLQITPKDATIEAVKTYTDEKVPKECIKYFYMKDGFRIAPAMSDSKTFLVFDNKEIDIEFDPSSSSPGEATGFYTTTIDFEVKYDDKIIGTVVADTRDVLKYKGYNTSKVKIGQADPIRSKCIEIVKAALEKNATFNYDIDKQTIKNYINNTYQQDEDIYSENGEFLFSMSCIGGALCLETYSVLYLNEYGFRTPRGGGVNHTSYSLISNPTQYFSIQGGK